MGQDLNIVGSVTNKSTGNSPSRLRRKRALVANLLALAIIVASFLAFSLAPDNGTRVRNALIATVAPKVEFIWSPNEAPQNFSADEVNVPVKFQELVMQLSSTQAATYPDDFQRAMQLARHLVSNKNDGGGIRSGDTFLTYDQIQTGKGYCADYSRVFTAMAVSAGIPVRAWGFGVDSFGSGHAFNEIYDKDRGKWILIDSFYSLYVVDKSTGIPLSVLEFRERLVDKRQNQDIQIKPIEPTKFAFKSSEQAISYYRKGSDQFYLNWGHNAFNSDDNSSAAFLATLPRPIEVGGRILAGIRPDIKILRTDSNQGHIDKLFRTKWIFLSLLAMGILLTVSLVMQIWLYRRISDSGADISRDH